MNTRVVVADETTDRKVWCHTCTALADNPDSREVRRHVKATSHQVTVAITTSVIYRRELTP